MVHIKSYNPSLHSTLIGKMCVTSEENLTKILQDAKEASESWKRSTLDSRITILRVLYDAFDSRREDIAKSIAQEMGMPIRQARNEVQYGLTYFLWYLENATSCLSPEITFENDTEKHEIHYEPKGIVAAIAPWNYPFSMFVWTCIQPLLAGNVVIFKISKDVILTGKLIADIVVSCTLPE
jgi:succinate-semialdehyde dehydrogenase/glutarate-semialdehyde dehydrogenase